MDFIIFQVTADGNETISTLTFRPTMSNNGKMITCRAVNSNVKVGFEEDNLKLNVYCKFIYLFSILSHNIVYK